MIHGFSREHTRHTIFFVRLRIPWLSLLLFLLPELLQRKPLRGGEGRVAPFDCSPQDLVKERILRPVFFAQI